VFACLPKKYFFKKNLNREILDIEIFGFNDSPYISIFEILYYYFLVTQ